MSKLTVEDVLAWLDDESDDATRAQMTERFGIPNEDAYGVPMGVMLKFAKRQHKDHKLAGDLWYAGWYETRTLAALLDEPDKVTRRQMDRWSGQFNSWAICDTTCFHLFDRAPFAWEKAEQWVNAKNEFVKRAGFALIWALSVHDKKATDQQFRAALDWIEASADDRPLVKKAIDMALRATGKRNKKLHRDAVAACKRMVKSDDASQAWIGKHSLRELQSEKVKQRL